MYNLNSNSTLTIGSDGVFYRVNSPTVLTDYFKNFTIKNRVADDAGLFMGGLFAETEIKLLKEKLRWIIGARADMANINEGNVHDTLATKGRNEYINAYNLSSGLIYNPVNNLFFSLNILATMRYSHL